MTVLPCTSEKRTESDKGKLKTSLLFFDQDCSAFCLLFLDPEGAKPRLTCLNASGPKFCRMTWFIRLWDCHKTS